MGNRSWVYGLVSPDAEVRRRTLTRHKALLAEAADALRRGNWYWAEARRRGWSGLPAQALEAYAEMRAHQDATIFGMTKIPEFAVVYLRWEVEFPDEWRDPAVTMWSPWSGKEGVLSRLGRDGVPDEFSEPVANLLDAVLRRPYRCKDWLYARVARQVDYRDRLDALRPEQPLRAEFVRYVLDHPDLHVTRKTWGRWLDLRAG
jgi:hypothetical protein